MFHSARLAGRIFKSPRPPLHICANPILIDEPTVSRHPPSRARKTAPNLFDV
jgi:hypothetical protein